MDGWASIFNLPWALPWPWAMNWARMQLSSANNHSVQATKRLFGCLSFLVVEIGKSLKEKKNVRMNDFSW